RTVVVRKRPRLINRLRQKITYSGGGVREVCLELNIARFGCNRLFVERELPLKSYQGCLRPVDQNQVVTVSHIRPNGANARQKYDPSGNWVGHGEGSGVCSIPRIVGD